MKTLILMALMAVGILGATAQAKDASQSVELAVTENGFEPKSIDVKPGTDVTLKVTRKTDSTCANQVLVPSRKIKVDLPLNKTVSVALGKLEKGEIRFGCGMNMMEGGRIVVRQDLSKNWGANLLNPSSTVSASCGAFEKSSKTELRFVEIPTDQSLKVTTFGEISTGVGAKQMGIGEFSTTIRIAYG